jgi:hypothetical protein
MQVENDIKSYKDMLLMLKDELALQNKKTQEIHMQNEYIVTEFKNLKQNTIIHDNSNNSIVQQNIMVSINAYGNENLTHLKNNDYLKCFNKGINCLVEYIRLKHYDPNHPENHNVYIPNIQQPYYKCYDGTKFIIQSIDKLVNDIIDTNLIELDDKYKELKETLFNKAIQRYGKFIEKYDSNERDNILAYLMKELKILMYNEKDKPINTEKSLK